MTPAGVSADPVITGIGAVTPLGLDVPESWRRLLAGESGVRQITAFEDEETVGTVANCPPESI